MGRILAIDYGTKRIGLAASDPLKIIASGLETVENQKIISFLETYLETEEVECFVVGEPFHHDDQPTQLTGKINEFINKLRKKFPNIPIERVDERHTSKDAKRIILDSGARKKKRRDKGLVDKVSAILILQEYLESNR